MNVDSNSLTFRAVALSGLALSMLVPVGMVTSVVHERRDLYQEVVQDVGAQWGGRQTITGPVLLVPFTEHWTSESSVGEDGSVKQIRHEETRDDVLVVLPERLDVHATMNVEQRRRGIYEATVYTAKTGLQGTFTMHDQTAPFGRTVEYHWDHATVALGVAAPAGIQQVDIAGLE